MKKILLLVVLFIALIFRLGGIFPGYPPYHSDEGISYSSAVSMIKNNNLDPQRYDYPALVPLINYFVFNQFFIPIYWTKFFVINFSKILEGYIKIPFDLQSYLRYFQQDVLGEREAYALIWGRIVTAFFGVGVVLLTFQLARRLFNYNVGIVAAIFAAVNYRLILNSHLGLPDIYNSFFLLLSIILSSNLHKDASKKNYLIAGVGLGLSLSIKFQVFAFLPFLLCHLLISVKEKTLKGKILEFVNSKFFIAIFTSIFLFFAINPYMLIRFEEALFQIQSVSLKYAAGRNTIDLFGLIYLYDFGLGKIISLFVVFGFMTLAFSRKTIFLLFSSVIIPFLIVTNYLTIGGFYTRNYLTIIPLLLIIAAFGILYVLGFVNRMMKNKYLYYFLLCVSVLSCIGVHFKNSIQVVKAYSQSWNYKIVETYNNNFIPSSAVVALHSSVPINPQQKRVPYELSSSFSLAEFKEAGASYAVANLDWTNVDFYWWMTAGLKDNKYLKKPVEILEETYPALATRELSDFAIFNVVNPWQAPDSNFIGSVIPLYKVESRELLKEYNFEKHNEGWTKEGVFQSPPDRLTWMKENDGSLKISKEGSSSKVLHWESPSLNVKNGEAYEVEGHILTDALVGPALRDGFIRVDFFKDSKRIATRLSSRITEPNINETKIVISQVPDKATSMKVGFQAYDMNLGNFYLNNLKISKVKIVEDLHGSKLEPFLIPEDILFPNSHGGL